MKNLIIFIALISFSNVVYTQNYIPLLGEQKFWIYGQNDDWEPAPRSIGAFIISIGVDTVINNLIYSKLIKYSLSGESPCSDRPCFTPYIPYQIKSNSKISLAYIREDTIAKKVYCLPAKPIQLLYCDTMEHILFDFNQKVGDTLSTCNLIIHSGGKISDTYFIIDSIDSEVLYGKQRKVWYFEGFNYGGLPYISTMKLIEGVGIIKNLGFYVDPTALFIDFCEGTLEQCNIISSLQEYDNYNKNDVLIFPNPVKDDLVLKTNLEILRIDVFNSNGQLILTGSDREVNTSSLLAGIYFIKLISKQNKQYFRKFVKM